MTSRNVYAFQLESGLVKIGVSGNVKARKKAIEYEMKENIVETYTSGIIQEAFMCEREIHNKLANYRVKGEWFDIDFSVAVKTIDNIIKRYATNKKPQYLFLKATMIKNGIDTKQLAKATGIPLKAINQCFNFRRDFRLFEAVLIRDYVAPKMKIDELFNPVTNRR